MKTNPTQNLHPLERYNKTVSQAYEKMCGHIISVAKNQHLNSLKGAYSISQPKNYPNIYDVYASPLMQLQLKYEQDGSLTIHYAINFEINQLIGHESYTKLTRALYRLTAQFPDCLVPVAFDDELGTWVKMMLRIEEDDEYKNAVL